MCRNLWLVALCLAYSYSLLFGNLANAQIKGYWKLDSIDKNVLLDEVGPEQSNGTVVGSPALVPGIDGNALELEGTIKETGAYMEDSATLNSSHIGFGDSSISAWVKYTEPSVYEAGPDLELGAIAGKGCIGGARGAGIYTVHNDLQFVVVGETTSVFRRARSGPYNDGQWHHVVGVLKRGQADGVCLYVDGALTATADSAVFDGVDLSNSLRFAVGTRYSGGDGFNWPLKGAVDDVQLYGIALTQSQINFLYANPGKAIPEPTSLNLLSLGSFAMLHHRRKGEDVELLADSVVDLNACVPAASPDICADHAEL